jgi:hypothetical protein
MQFVRRSLQISMCTASLSLLVNAPARAAVWGVKPRAVLNLRHDSNVQMASSNEFSGESLVALAGASVLRYSDSLRWSLDPQVTLIRYTQTKEFDRDEVQVSSGLNKYFERGSIGAAASYIRDTTLTSELGSTGLTLTNLPHERISVSLSPEYSTGEKSSLSGSAGWSTDRYPGAANDSALVDYDYVSSSMRYSYQYSQRSSVALAASYGRSVVPSYQQSTDQWAANLIWQSAITEQWNMMLGVGPMRVESEFIKDDGIQYTAQLTHRAVVDNLDLSLSHDVAPNGRGVVSKRIRAGANYSRRLTDRWSTQLGVQWIDSRDIVSSIGFQLDGVRYLDANAMLGWQITPTISATLNAGWTTQERTLVAARAHGYRAFIGLSWHGLERGH